jgi:hypothetical protein
MRAAMLKRETYWHIFVDAWKLTREGLALPWAEELDKWDSWCRRVKELRVEYPTSRLAKVLSTEIIADVMEAKRKDWYERKKRGEKKP